MTNLALLKQTDSALLTCFVIDQLSPADRLSVASSSSHASSLAKLVRMSDAGKAKDKAAVESLIAGGSTRIGEGLCVAADVLGAHGPPSQERCRQPHPAL